MTTQPLSALAQHYAITPTETGYLLKGKRGATYGLLRNLVNPRMLFAVGLGAKWSLPALLKGQMFVDDQS